MEGLSFMIDVFKILVVFLAIVVGLRLTKSLPISVLLGGALAALLFRLGIFNTLQISGKALVSEMTIVTVLAFYSITYLQRMMENRKQLDLAQQALNGIFNNRRVNTALAPVFIGMLPSAGAVTICGAIVDKAAEDYLTVEEKTFVTSYYRHIPESLLPTYSTILIGVQISGQQMGDFLLWTLPLVVFLALLGHLFYLRKIPKATGQPPSQNKGNDLLNLFKSFWSILLTILLIITFNLPVYIAVTISILINIFVNRFRWKELRPIFRSAFESRLILTTVCIMIFKDIIIETGIIGILPKVLSSLPIPAFLTFFIIFFCGTIISGQQSINVVGLPLAFATIPGAGVPLLVYLMGAGYAAMQMSPTHVCLAIISEYFKVDMGVLIKKTAPVIATFCVVLTGYYFLLNLFLK